MDQYFVRDGRFEVDGVGIDEIAAVYDTPFYLYSAGLIRDRYQMLTDHFPGFDIFYSFKANPGLAICKTLLSLGACADVSSMGELQAAQAVGFRPESIAFVGPGKTTKEIESAIESGIYAIAAESAHELALIDSLAQKAGRPVDVLLRINTLEEPISPEMMVGGPSKFGFDEETVVDEVRGVRLKSAKLAGIHVYSASQVLDSDLISEHLVYVMNLAVRICKELRFKVRCIDFGGGFGVPYQQGEVKLDLRPISKVAEWVRVNLSKLLPDCRLIFQIGRYLVAESGIFVTRALRVKRSRGICFIITDGGMNHFSRPVFMRVNHRVRILNKIGLPPQSKCSVGGPICTPIDIIGKEVMLPVPEPGDLIGIFGAGAYGYTMSMHNFMSLGAPAEIMIDGGTVHLIREPVPADSLFPAQHAEI
jgi:diaminopimelate decarboxylase